MGNLIVKESKKIKLRFAKEEDITIVLSLINELADYVNQKNNVVTTEDLLMDSLFKRKVAEVVIVEYENSPVGYALFFSTFSTFLGKSGIYMEDLYVQPHMRGKGLGKILMSYIAEIALERDCGRLEWSCLDWNETSIKFYKSLGAVPISGSTKYRAFGNTLGKLAKNK